MGKGSNFSGHSESLARSPTSLGLGCTYNRIAKSTLGDRDECLPRHPAGAFVGSLRDIVASQPRGREIQVIADNLSTHKTQAVRRFLLAHPHVRIHFTPTYSSWLNQVELWFAKIERDLLARGIFTSLPPGQFTAILAGKNGGIGIGLVEIYKIP